MHNAYPPEYFSAPECRFSGELLQVYLSSSRAAVEPEKERIASQTQQGQMNRHEMDGAGHMGLLGSHRQWFRIVCARACAYGGWDRLGHGLRS